jgi:predicted secreted hydrolase
MMMRMARNVGEGFIPSRGGSSARGLREHVKCSPTWALLMMLMMVLAGCASHQLQDVGALADVDHGPHDFAQTEWWHVHADLVEPGTGEAVHVFAAFVVQRTDLDRVVGLPAWLGGNPVHAAYVKVQTRDRKWTADRSNIPDHPMARFVGDGLDLRHSGWRVAWEGQTLVLKVGAGRHRLELRLDPVGEPVLPGDEGLVELVPGARHRWVQHSGMQVRGRWKDGGRTRWLEGTGFYKHQWGRLYDPQLDGFEWIDLPLDDQRHLVVAWLLDDGMRGVPGSMAFIADREGRRVDLPVEQLRLTPLGHWRSLRSGAHWTTGWRIEGAGLDLTVATDRDDQEVYGFPAAVYAGPAHARGSFMGRPVDSQAFVEQVGAHMPRARVLYASRVPGATTQPAPALATRGLSVPGPTAGADSGTSWTLERGVRTWGAPPPGQVPSGQTVVTVLDGPGAAAPAADPAELELLIEALESSDPEDWDALLGAVE